MRKWFVLVILFSTTAGVVAWAQVANSLVSRAITRVATALEDSAHTSGDPMVTVAGVRIAACGTALSGSANDYNPIQFDANGNLCVNIATNGAGSTTDTDDASIATGQSNIALTAGLQMYYNGTAWVRVTPSPCSDNSLLVSVPIDIVTAATTEVVGTASGASSKIYICAVNLVSAGANNVALVEDDTDACASPTAGMAGGVTAGEGWNFAANGGLTLGNGVGMVAKSAAVNRYVCLITSAAVQLSGTITYALAP